ncbi:DNA-binding response regulator [Dyadobacter endophyticus]|uniref:DNA-binding response regulator n=2 Tax=Dyadobacter endophyticus TaxID=1749036 RepID=A0ABQ1YQW1_9BACT|nr:DNA-binding response regulator [Dyadobacter endophyticus]
MLVDDHVLVAEGFRELLKRMLPAGAVIDIFSSVETATAALKTMSYGILITDLIMPGQNVMSFITACRKQYDELIILVVSSSMDSNGIKACFAAGANGYLSKAVSPSEIKLALEYTMAGKKFVSADLAGKLADNIFSAENTVLTSKEREVLALIGAGKRTKEIAETLFVSPITIMTHKRNIMRKLDLHSVSELVRYVFNNNLF